MNIRSSKWFLFGGGKTAWRERATDLAQQLGRLAQAATVYRTRVRQGRPEKEITEAAEILDVEVKSARSTWLEINKE